MTDQTRLDAPAGVATRLHLGGIGESTKLVTANGLMPVEKITAGTRMPTRSAGMQRVILITQRLVADGQAFRIRPRLMGGDPKASDLVLSASQRVVLSDWRAKALRGTARVALPVRDLEDGEGVRPVAVGEARFFSLHFNDQHVIYAGEVELASAAAVSAFLG